MQTISTSRKKAGKGKPVPADSKRMPHRPLFGRRLNILIYIGGTAQLYRDLFSGSLAFCRVHDVFNLRIVNSVPELRRLARERDIAFDGVAFIPVTMYGKFQTRSKIVSYNGCPKRRRPPAHVIDFTTDNAAVARMAAEHLLANPSVKKCVYVWDSTVPGNQFWMQERLAAFRIAVEAAGREFESLDITRFFSTKRNIVLETSRRFARFLQAQPRVTALFAGNDEMALLLLQPCRHAQVRIPSGIMILGCDDDQILCENASPTLSSIKMSFFDAGWQAMQTLHTWLRNPAEKPEPRVFGPMGVVTRESTTVLAPARAYSPWVDAAVTFIGLNAGEPVHPCDIAAHVKVKQRSLVKRFRQETGHSLLTAIHAAHVEHIKRLLTETSLSVTAVCAMGGYASRAHAVKMFRRITGTTPREYRERMRETRG